jgi:hypothetical protein
LYQPQMVDDDKYGKVGGIVVRKTEALGKI